MKINIQEKYYFLFYALFLIVFVFSILAIIRNTPVDNFFQASLFSFQREQGEEEKIEEIEETVEQVKDVQMQVQKGEGLTHLARRALKDYQSEEELSSEHKIYIEDYVQKRLDYSDLHPGDTISISTELIQEAIDQALQLREHELENLKQYSNLVFL